MNIDVSKKIEVNGQITTIVGTDQITLTFNPRDEDDQFVAQKIMEYALTYVKTIPSQS